MRLEYSRLQRYFAKEPAHYARMEHPALERRGARRPLRIIVADDDHDTVDTLAAILRDEGHTVYPVYGGREVLPAVRIMRPDAIIIDIAVPGMSGYAVAQQVRHAFTDVRRPLMIAISGMWKDASDKLIARQVGFDHYLEKPCMPKDLLRLLSRDCA
jgi:DNA-binding response OmpR family regulator